MTRHKRINLDDIFIQMWKRPENGMKKQQAINIEWISYDGFGSLDFPFCPEGLVAPSCILLWFYPSHQYQYILRESPTNAFETTITYDPSWTKFTRVYSSLVFLEFNKNRHCLLFLIFPACQSLMFVEEISLFLWLSNFLKLQPETCLIDG